MTREERIQEQLDLLGDLPYGSKEYLDAVKAYQILVNLDQEDERINNDAYDKLQKREAALDDEEYKRKIMKSENVRGWVETGAKVAGTVFGAAFMVMTNRREDPNLGEGYIGNKTTHGLLSKWLDKNSR